MKSQRDILKEMTFPQKVSHIWYYYKWMILGSIFVIGCIVSLIVSIRTQKEYVLNVAIIDYIGSDSNRFIVSEMSERLQITEDQAVYVDTSLGMDEERNNSTVIYNTFQKFNTLIAAGDYDVIIDDGIVPQNYAAQDVLVDLRTLMTEEQQERYQDRFYVKKDSNGNDIVAGLFIADMPWTEDAKLNKEKPLVSVVSTGVNQEQAKEMFQWMLTYQ